MKINFIANAATLLSGILALTTAQAKNVEPSCPVKSSITQMQKSNGSIEYKASDSSGAVWRGENPQGDLSQLAVVKFLEAYLVDGDKLAVCDYVKGQVGIRMSLTLKTPATPVANWKAEKQPRTGVSYPHCTAEPEDCTFQVAWQALH